MTTTVDPHLGARWRQLAFILRGEKAVQTEALAALQVLAAYSKAALGVSGMDPQVLDNRAAPWRAALNTGLVPAVEDIFTASWDATARGAIDSTPYATRHIESVWNRMVGVADTEFDTLRTVIEEGRAAGESIPQLAKRVDAHLSDAQRWKGRATMVARTEVVGASSMGSHAASRASADYLGVDHKLVAKRWLATEDARTRPTHRDADGQIVMGLDTPFSVGGAALLVPGDPSGPAKEVIQCRCAPTYSYPGDPDYPQETPMPALTAAGESEDGTQYGVVVVALPAADDPVHDIGAEDKHATLLYFGDTAGGDNPNALLTDDLRALIEEVCAEVAARLGPISSEVTAVESLGDDGARVWMLADDGLPAARRTLLGEGGPTEADPNGEMEDALLGVEQYPDFTPHVTVGYPAADPATVPEGDRALLDPDTEVAAADVASIRFDRVALWWAGEQTEWALTGGQDQEDDMSTTTDEGLTAAAQRALGRATRTLARERGITVEAATALLAAAGDPAPTLQTLDAGDPAPSLMEEVADLDDQFYGVLIVENSQTGDRRVFAPGSIRLDAPLPMPIGWQVSDAPGHDGSVVCGRFDTFTRIGNLIAYTGTWDLDGAGWETRRLVQGRFLTGLSADTDDCEVQIVTEDGEALGGFDFMFSDEEPLLLVTDSRIRSGAMCRVPAFTEAFVANGTPPPGWAGERPDGTMPAEDEAPEEGGLVPEETAQVELVASAVRADNPPVLQPIDPRYFTNPQLTEPTPLTVESDGRVFGHIATWGTCHIGIEGYCQEPPVSASNYAYFATGALPTSDGGRVHVGALTMGTGHARPGASLREAVEHYDNTGAVVADITTGQDGLGIWFSGRLRPEATPEQIHALAAAGSVSGDWREAVRWSGDLELVAALVVNVPGFPIPRPTLAASGGRVTGLVAAGLVRDTAVAAYTLQEAATLAADLLEDRLARRDRALAAQSKMKRARRARTLTRLDSALARADRSS